MIENIHSHEGEEKDKKRLNYTFKPPKNIKQIGEGTSSKKIYVEDYVFTYIKDLLKKEYEECKIAVLLGHYYKTQESRIILINGAVEAEGLRYDTESVFDNDTWTGIYENIKRYFTDVEVVGWCIGGTGHIVHSQDRLKKIHLDHFAGVDKALFKYDCFEEEEAFYLYENGMMNQQEGYYIYYDKNEDMQNYILNHTQNRNLPLGQKTVEVHPDIHEMPSTATNKNIVHLAYAAASLFAIIVLTVFATMINNNHRIQTLEETMAHLSNTLSSSIQQLQENSSQAEVETPTQGMMEVETISGTLNSIKEEDVIGDQADNASNDEQLKQEDSKEESTSDTTNEKQETKNESEVSETTDSKDKEIVESVETNTKQEDTKQDEKEDKKSEKKENSKDVSSNEVKVKYYEVQKGDTLVGISLKLYKSVDYVSQIMKLNGIEDQNVILYGQKLIVP